MDFSTAKVCFFVLVQLYLLAKVVPCDLPSGADIFGCGSGISSPNDCPKTCCFHSAAKLDCFFRKDAYGPIRHSNGLCVNVKRNSYTRLIWSTDCNSRNAFFLVSYDHPPFHVASGKCVLPSNGNVANPETTELSLWDYTESNCKGTTVTYRAKNSGNLQYYYVLEKYETCLVLESKDSSEPQHDDPVSISKPACSTAVKSCKEDINYVYQRKFDEGEKNETFTCVLGRTIQVIWANYGVQVQNRYPLAISTSGSECVTNTATSVMQKKCDGRTQCEFTVNDGVFSLSSCQQSPKILLVRYTCKADAVPAAPKMLNVIVEGQNQFLIEWSNDAGVKQMFKICALPLASTGVESCTTGSFPASLSRITELPTKLKAATKYNVTVARYSCDGTTIGKKRHRIAITRSAALKAQDKKSATSFEIKLGTLQDDDMYVQVVVSKRQSIETPTTYPRRNELTAYDKKTVDSRPYIAAELDRTDISNSLFTVGDGGNYERSRTRKKRSTNFKNVKLKPETFYSVLQRTFKSDDLYYDSDWMDVIKTEKPNTKQSFPTTALTRATTNKKSGGGGSVLGDQGGGGSDGDGDDGNSAGIIGGAAGGAVLLIILVILVIIFIRRRRRDNSSNSNLYDKPVKYKHSKRNDRLNEENDHQNNLSLSSEEFEENANVITAPSGDLYARPIKNKRTENAQHENAVQNETYANMQVDIPDEDDTKGVKISRFLFYCDEMKKNENFGFKNEFKELPVGQTHPWDVGREAKNVQKNRYANTVAYDYSRVMLSGEENYINANLIQGIHSEVYIAAQGPTEQTVNDFWRMIWEQDCTCIIALTKVVELGKVKCVQYWADEGETTFGEIHVKTVKTELFADYVIRYLDMKKDGKGKKVTQYHFISWPDHGVPKYPTKLLAFRHRFRALHTVSGQPIVIHCSAGVGRTGTFIALDITLLRLNQLQEQTINIKDTINELRNQRVNMVQTLEQYILVHDAVLEMVLCGFTEIEADNFKTEIERLEQKELNKSFTGFEIEFKKLASVCHPLALEECKAGLNQKNKSKNRDSNIYPTENLRVFLSGSKAEEDPYINATYVRGYTHVRAYIATQSPLPNTINDFWKMVFEKKTVVVVMLNNINEGKTTYPQYWPEDFNQEQQYGDLFVKMVSAETQGPIVSRKFVITNKNQKAAVAEHVVRHVQLTDWPEDGVPVNHNDVMELLDTVEEAQQRSVNGAVIVHCSNGAHRTGTYLTLAIQRERVRSEHVIDIFRCIKMLREQRPQFVGNVNQYKFCYDAMLTFMESFKTYDNIPKTQKE